MGGEKLIDLTGQKFGRLTVLYKDKNNKKKQELIGFVNVNVEILNQLEETILLMDILKVVDVIIQKQSEKEILLI